MASAVSKVSMIQSLEDNLLINILTFLEPGEIARAERVSGQWRKVIGADDELVWKECCARENIPVITSDSLAVDTSLGSYALQAQFTGNTALPLHRLELHGLVDGSSHKLNWIIDAGKASPAFLLHRRPLHTQ